MIPANKRDGVPVGDVSEERLRSMLDNAPIMVYVYGSDGRLLFGNREFERVLGVDRGALIGKLRVDFFSPEDAAVHRAHDLAVMASGQGSRLEETLPQADGEHTYISDKFPLRDGDGDIYAVGGISTDITGRRRAEEALRRSDARLAEAQGTYHVGHWDWDIVGGQIDGQTRCIGSSARLRRNSLPTIVGSSAECTQTIAGQLSGRSMTRCKAAGHTSSNIGLSVRTAKSECWPSAVRPRSMQRVDRSGCPERSRTSPTAREPSVI
jgi:PAS domain S-box-containing protein